MPILSSGLLPTPCLPLPGVRFGWELHANGYSYFVGGSGLPSLRHLGMGMLGTAVCLCLAALLRRTWER